MTALPTRPLDSRPNSVRLLKDRLQRLAAGVAVFDHEGTAGWRTGSTLEKPERFESTLELEANWIWILQASWERCRQLQVKLGPTLKHEAWLKSTLPELRREWGLADENPAGVVDVLGEVLRRILLVAGRVLESLAVAGAKISAPFAEDTLAKELRQYLRQLGHLQGLVRGVEAADALEMAYQPTSATTVARAPDGAWTTWLRRPRFLHFLRLMTEPTPMGSWEGVDVAGLPDPIETLRATGRPAILEVDWGVQPGRSNLARLFAWGSRGRQRSWACLEEVLLLRQFANVDVRRAVVAEGWSPKPLAEILLRPFRSANGEIDAVHAYSWSAGLVAESMLAAIIQHDEKSRRAPSALTVWTALRDRLHCFEAAVRLASHGISVTHYRLGSLLTWYTDAQLPALSQASWDAGLLLPMELAATMAEKGIAAPDPALWGGDKLGLPLGLAHRQNRRDVLWQLDLLVGLDAGEAAAKLERLLS